MNKLIIIGAGGHSRVAIEIATLIGYEVIKVIDINFSNSFEVILGFPVVGNLSYLETIDLDEHDVFVAIGENAERKKVTLSITDYNLNIINLIHPTSYVSTNAILETGILINTRAMVNVGASISQGAIVNTGTIVDHESIIGEYVHLGPGVNIAGRVKIGASTFVGIGTSVIDKLEIGANVTIGAGSVIIRNIEDNSKVVGISKVISE